MIKDPLDLVIVQQLLWELKPRTVIDIDLSLLDPEAKKSPDVEFIEGDSMQVEKLFPAEFLEVG